MKTLWVITFGLLVAAFAAVFAIAIYATLHDENKDPPEIAARKDECRQLVRHLIEVSPYRDGRSIEDTVAKIPVEDIEQCGAAYPESVTCMRGAKDIAAVKNCIPEHVDCKGPETVVTGTRPVYEVGGDCKTVVVKTSSARVVVKSAKPPTIRDEGTNNHITQ